jgi:fimbrial chaperone protein
MAAVQLIFFSPFRRLLAALLMVVATLGASSAALAMRVSPMIVEMGTNGADGVARIELQNLNQEKLPYEVRVTRIEYHDDGTITETPADDDFLVFPPQGVLLANARQVIRVQWVGPQLDSSRAYYVSVNQLPVTLDAPRPPGQAPVAQLQIVYHMKALVVVSPPNATPNVTTVEAHAAPYQPKAKLPDQPPPTPVAGIAVTLRNTGKRHAMMAGLVWVVSGTGQDGKPLQVVYSLQQLNEFIGSGYIGPIGAVRTYSLPTPTPFGPGPLKVRFRQ